MRVLVAEEGCKMFRLLPIMFVGCLVVLGESRWAVAQEESSASQLPEPRSRVYTRPAIDSDDPEKRFRGPDPPLSEEEKEQIRNLSRELKFEVIRKGDRLQAQFAFVQVLREGYNDDDIRTLLEIRGALDRTIVEGLCKVKYEKAATDDEKRRIDYLVDLLAERAREGDALAVNGLGRLIMRSHSHEVDHGQDITVSGLPYANRRVTDILLECLRHESYHVRLAAAKWLGTVGANEPDRSDEIIAQLQDQLEKEETVGGYSEAHSRVTTLYQMRAAIRRIEQRLTSIEQRKADLLLFEQIEAQGGVPPAYP